MLLKAPAPAPDDLDCYFKRSARRARFAQTLTVAAMVVFSVVAGVAYWQRGVAIEQREIANQQRQRTEDMLAAATATANEQRQIASQQRLRAEDTLAAATATANSLVFDLALRFHDAAGIPASLIKDILDRARVLQEQLIKSGNVTPIDVRPNWKEKPGMPDSWEGRPV